MPPLPGVLAMHSPSQTATQSFNTSIVNPTISKGSSCFAEMSTARTDLVTNNSRICNVNKFENISSTALNAITSVTPSSSRNNISSTANMVPSKNSAATSSSDDSKNTNPPLQSASGGGGGGGSDCGSTSDSGSSSSSSSSSDSGSSTSSSSTSSNQSKSPISNKSKDSLNSNSGNGKNKDSSKSKMNDSGSAAAKDSCDNKDNENGSVELSTEVDSDTGSSSMFGRPRKILLKSVNAHITCSLCNGYLIDATTIVECLHSFCHSCIMNYLRKDQYCPRCEMMINTTKHNNIKLDTTLQAIVYKLVPGLYERELLRKRAFYSTRPEEAKLATPEQRGDDTEHLIFGPADNMSLSLEYADVEEIPDDDIFELRKPKYLQCPANFTVAHLKKFVFGKFGIDQSRFTIDIMYKVKTIVLADHYKMMDVAYIYTWKRDAPMKFFFRVKESENRPRRKKCNKLAVAPAPPKPTDEKKTETKTEDNKQKVEELDEKKTEETKDDPEIKVEIKEEVEVEVRQETAELNVDSTEDLCPVPEDCMVVVPVVPELIADVGAALSPKERIKVKSDEELFAKTTIDNESSPNVALEAKEIKESPPAKQTSPARKESPEHATPDPRTEKLKITLVNKGKHSPKGDDTPKSKSSSKNKSSKHSPPEPDDRKVENIKLKIGLSKQGSVTIINMSVPEANKKENIKPAKADKEWKIKVRKDKDKDKDKSNGSHDKGKASSPHEKTVPPITIEIGKSSSPSSNKTEESKLQADDDVKKSEFLNSIDLTPIKSINSPEKIDRQKTGTSKSPTLPTTSFTIKKPSMPPPPAPPSSKPSAASKRKSKEPVKAVPKKPRLDLPLIKPPALPQIKVRTNLLEPPKEKPAISFKLSPFPIGSLGESKMPTEKSPSPPVLSPQKDKEAERKLEDEKLMPAPPPLKMLDVFKRNGVKGSSKAKSGNSKQAKATNSNEGFLRPIVTTSMAQNSKVPIVSNMMGNRTPIARRYPPILPKSQSKNPFASLAGDVGGFLQGSSTEIKPIQNGENKEIKIYGPPAVTSANSSQKPAVSVATSVAAMQQQSHQRSSSKPSSTNYLNAALMNSAKSKMAEMPLGCRTPIYTPSSPIYSPNSPQYMPNYNIPIQPTYKYTKTQSSATNYLQSILGSNKQMSNLFPAPPVKQESSLGGSKPDGNSGNAAKLNNASTNHGKISPEPSERQTPVQSLLNSCNINIPSSLSITIRNENDDANSSKLSKMKHSSPVNNYIEILKLPDTTVTSEPAKPTLIGSSDVKTLTNPKSPTNLKLSDALMNSASTSPPITNTVPNVKNDTKMQNSTSKSKSPAVTESDKKSPPSAAVQKPSKKTPSPDKKGSEKRKAEKRSASDLTKSPKDKFDISPAALKKFRPILPRSKTPPPTQSPLPSMPSLSANVMPKLGPSNTKQSQAKHKKAAPKTSNQSTKAQQNAAASAKKVLAEAAAQRKSVTPPASMPSPLMHSPPMPPTGGLSAELTAFLTQQRQLLQQQQQQQSSQQSPFAPLMAAAAAGNPNFLPHLAGFHPAAANINMQRAYIMEHLARMQKAGAEAMEKYMQLKNNNVSCVKSPSGSPGSEGSPNNSMSNNVKNSV